MAPFLAWRGLAGGRGHPSLLAPPHASSELYTKVCLWARCVTLGRLLAFSELPCFSPDNYFSGLLEGSIY